MAQFRRLFLAQLSRLFSRGPLKALGRTEKKNLRNQAQRMWERCHGKRASQMGLDIHHRIPLEWAHLMPGDPNRRANLIGIDPKTHDQIDNAWRNFKKSLGGRTPTASEIMQQASAIDRMYGYKFKPF